MLTYNSSRLYIIEGAITMAVGLAAIFILPDFPETWKGLTPEMRRVAVRRLAIDAAEADTDEGGGMSQIRGMKLAFTDPKTYICKLDWRVLPTTTNISQWRLHTWASRAQQASRTSFPPSRKH